MPIRSLVFLLLIFSSCNSDMDDELVVDYLDMSANDFSVQVSYSSDIEIFQNESHETCISTHCFIGRRVLPKNGSIEIDKSKILIFDLIE